MKILLTIPETTQGEAHHWHRGPVPTIELTKEQLNKVLLDVDGKQYLLGIKVVTTTHGRSRDCPNVMAGRWIHCHGHDEDVLITRPIR